MAASYRTNEGTARIIGGVGTLFAVVEAAYILLFVFEADPTNKLYTFVESWANPLALFFPGLFRTDSTKLDVVLNYGLAAIFWLVVTSFLARLVARL
ncbi:hypothetical protein [Nocardia otitidiscaviarum]|uniref:hypothetical protein n=1 Tax=Nocardia otitidiscaviarum TaxID=1823 RepID=UPI001E55AFF9|nr:hypothetical protein [Nocardia otitidiscaviarum]